MKNLSWLASSAVVVAVGAVLATPNDAAACRLTVGDRVWYDANNNGIQDSDEAGINGVRLTIDPPVTLPDWTVVSQAVTGNNSSGAAGFYQFNSVKCDIPYTIRVDMSTVPAGYQETLIRVGSDENVDSDDPAGVTFTLANTGADYANMSFDFGFRAPACTAAIGNFVWFDANNNGIQEAGEPGISGAVVTLNGTQTMPTDANGVYSFAGLCAGTYQVCVQIPPGAQASPTNQGASDLFDSDGTTNGANSCTTVTLPESSWVDDSNDFGFYTAPASPGTGTPGYWKNHPDAWPVDSITIGGVTYSKAQAINWLQTEDAKDKTVTMFRGVVAAKLNVLIGNASSCVASEIAAADNWLSAPPAGYGPVGSGVRASSAAWKIGEPFYRVLDNYNNGMLCAPHRD